MPTRVLHQRLVLRAEPGRPGRGAGVAEWHVPVGVDFERVVLLAKVDTEAASDQITWSWHPDAASAQIAARCGFFALSGGSKIVVNVQTIPRGASMKRILAIAGVMVLALILMDTYQVVKAPSGLTVARTGQALGADMRPPPPPPPPPPPAPVGKGKAPIGYGKGKAPPPVVTKG
jgi:hypothetical protein